MGHASRSLHMCTQLFDAACRSQICNSMLSRSASAVISTITISIEALCPCSQAVATETQCSCASSRKNVLLASSHVPFRVSTPLPHSTCLHSMSAMQHSITRDRGMLAKSPEQGMVGKTLLKWKFKRACWRGLVPREASMPENMLQSMSLSCSMQLMPSTGACRGSSCTGKAQISFTNTMFGGGRLCFAYV